MKTPLNLTGAETVKLYEALQYVLENRETVLPAELSYRLLKFRDAVRPSYTRIKDLEREAIIAFGSTLEEALKTLKAEYADETGKVPGESIAQFMESEKRLKEMLTDPTSRIVLPKNIPDYNTAMALPLNDPEFTSLNLSAIPLAAFTGVSLNAWVVAALGPILADSESLA